MGNNQSASSSLVEFSNVSDGYSGSALNFSSPSSVKDSSSSTTIGFIEDLGEDFLAITPSLSVSAPVAVEVAPVVTDSAPASTPAVVDAPVATATPAVAPVDANAQPPVDTSGQNQRLFLPIITNVSDLAGAALGGSRGLLILLLVLVIGGIVWQRRRGRGGR